jgi:hypothetical protein
MKKNENEESRVALKMLLGNRGMVQPFLISVLYLPRYRQTMLSTLQCESWIISLVLIQPFMLKLIQNSICRTLLKWNVINIHTDETNIQGWQSQEIYWVGKIEGKVVKIILMTFAYCYSCYFFGTKRRSSGKSTDDNISCKFVVQWPPF